MNGQQAQRFFERVMGPDWSVSVQDCERDAAYNVVMAKKIAYWALRDPMRVFGRIHDEIDSAITRMSAKKRPVYRGAWKK